MAARMIWLVEWKEWSGYDVYMSFVVCCETEEEARNTHPSQSGSSYDLYKEEWGKWGEWVKKEDVGQLCVTKLGVAFTETPSGVLTNSMRHG